VSEAAALIALVATLAAAVPRPAWAPDWIVATPVLAASTVALWLALQAT